MFRNFQAIRDTYVAYLNSHLPAGGEGEVYQQLEESRTASLALKKCSLRTTQSRAQVSFQYSNPTDGASSSCKSSTVRLFQDAVAGRGPPKRDLL